MKKMQIKTGRQAERTVKELKQLWKLNRSIFDPAKSKTPLSKPKNLKSTKRKEETSSKKKQSKQRQKPKNRSTEQPHTESVKQPVRVGFKELIARIVHTFCEREPTHTLKTLRTLGYLAAFTVALIAGCTLALFYGKGDQVLEFIAGDHLHSEASRVVVSTEKKS